MFRLALVWVGLTGAAVAGLAAQGAPAELTVGRLHYDGGGDWYANPSSLPNLLNAIRSRTALHTARTEQVVTLGSDDLWNVPYL